MSKYRLFSCVAAAFLIAMLIVPSGVRASTITTVDNAGGEPYQSMAMGRDGFARMVYYDWGGSQLKYAQCTNADCSTKNINVIGPRGSNNDIAVGPDGLARIIYYGNDLQYVTCANNDCSTSTTTTIASRLGLSSNFQAVSIVVGSDNLARIIYKQNPFSGGSTLKYIRCLDNTCTSTIASTVDNTESLPNNISLAICGDGFPCMTYGQANGEPGETNAVRFAHCTDDDCTSASTATLGSVDPSGDDLAIGNDGFPRIIWTTSGGPNINYILCANASCTSSTTTAITTNGPADASGSIAIGRDGLARISYYPRSGAQAGYLTYDVCNNDACTSPSSTGIEYAGGGATSLAIGTDGFARVAYSTGGSGNVKLWVESTDPGSTPECDDYAVIYCGAYTQSELLSYIANGDGRYSASNLQQIYYNEGRGITQEGIEDSVDGYITHSGDVYVGGSGGTGGTLVATGALTSGRLFTTGSTPDGSIYRRDHAFAASLDYENAFIGMSGSNGSGTFQWAILKPCGNPVIATPTGGGGSPSPSTPPPPPPPHNCCQITNRSVTLGSTVVSASTTANFSWHAGTATTTRAVKITVCTTAAYSDPCTKPTGASMSAATLASTGGQLGASGWSLAVVDDHTVLVTKSAGSATTVGGTQTVGIANFINPSTYGTFHFRITTYNEVDADPDDIVDCGTVSTSTAKSLTPVVDVSEALVFRVANAVAADCTSQTDITDPNDTTEDLVTLNPAPISLASPSTSTAQMCIVSNAQHGYVITYHDEAEGGPTKGFYNGAHEFGTYPGGTVSPGHPSIGDGTYYNFTSTPGTEQFGFNLRLNTVPAFGHDPDAAGLVADLTNPQYSTVNQYSYDDTGAPNILAAKSAPSLSARYYMAYIANINSLTPGGTYQAHQVFVATATF